MSLIVSADSKCFREYLEMVRPVAEIARYGLTITRPQVRSQMDKSQRYPNQTAWADLGLDPNTIRDYHRWHSPSTFPPSGRSVTLLTYR